VNAEFNWWLLIVGLVVGAGLVWYVLLDSRRREIDIDASERPREAAWLSATLADEGWAVPPEAADRMLELHAAYLDAPPPDEPDEPQGPQEPQVLQEVRPPDPTPETGPSEIAGDDRIGPGI
jgi:hypothetical protein